MPLIAAQVHGGFAQFVIHLVQHVVDGEHHEGQKVVDHAHLYGGDIVQQLLPPDAYPFQHVIDEAAVLHEAHEGDGAKQEIHPHGHHEQDHQGGAQFEFPIRHDMGGGIAQQQADRRAQEGHPQGEHQGIDVDGIPAQAQIFQRQAHGFVQGQVLRVHGLAGVVIAVPEAFEVVQGEIALGIGKGKVSHQEAGDHREHHQPQHIGRSEDGPPEAPVFMDIGDQHADESGEAYAHHPVAPHGHLKIGHLAFSSVGFSSSMGCMMWMLKGTTARPTRLPSGCMVVECTFQMEWPASIIIS